MKFIPVVAVSTLLMTFITGCSKQTYTADYLLKDEAKRKEILADCKDNKQTTENCNNANQAQSAIEMNAWAEQTKREAAAMKAKNDADMKKMFSHVN